MNIQQIQAELTRHQQELRQLAIALAPYIPAQPTPGDLMDEAHRTVAHAGALCGRARTLIEWAVKEAVGE